MPIGKTALVLIVAMIALPASSLAQNGNTEPYPIPWQTQGAQQVYPEPQATGTYPRQISGNPQVYMNPSDGSSTTVQSYGHAPVTITPSGDTDGSYTVQVGRTTVFVDPDN